jgi:hypothetical protein
MGAKMRLRASGGVNHSSVPTAALRPILIEWIRRSKAGEHGNQETGTALRRTQNRRNVSCRPYLHI